MTDDPPAKVGRPTDYSPETADAICERLADGESLRTICEAADMPAKSTVFRWLSLHKEFADQYARAREAQADSLVDDILPIADDGRNDWMLRQGTDAEDEIWQQNPEAMRRSQLRIDARKWMAGKLQPKKYGDATTLKHADADGKNLVPILNVLTGPARPPSPSETG